MRAAHLPRTKVHYKEERMEKPILIETFVQACNNWRKFFHGKSPETRDQALDEFLDQLDLERDEYVEMRSNINALVKVLRLRIAELEDHQNWEDLLKLGIFFNLGKRAVDQWAIMAVEQALIGCEYRKAAELVAHYEVPSELSSHVLGTYQNDCHYRNAGDEFSEFCFEHNMTYLLKKTRAF